MKPGDIVTVDFPGITGIKRRPVVVVSTPLYHRYRPDVIVAVITSQTSAGNTPLDYELQDWQQAGLRRPSAFRAFLATLPERSAIPVGRCSDCDWEEIQARLSRAIAVSGPLRLLRETE